MAPTRANRARCFGATLALGLPLCAHSVIAVFYWGLSKEYYLHNLLFFYLRCCEHVFAS